MRLRAFTDYSLRVLTYLAVEPERRVTIAEIAAAFAISENHLMKVVHFLGRHGFLSNLRGKGGGMTLARPAAEINLAAVVRLTEADAVLTECFDATGNQCVITPACQLRKVLSDAVTAFYAALDRYTLADLMGERQHLAGILSIPRSRMPGGPSSAVR